MLSLWCQFIQCAKTTELNHLLQTEMTMLESTFHIDSANIWNSFHYDNCMEDLIQQTHLLSSLVLQMVLVLVLKPLFQGQGV